MTIAGLFVGVSRFDGQDIPDLQFAQCDARALHAFFADANLTENASEGACGLLLNEEATRTALLDALDATVANANSGGAEIVIVHVSTHGTPAGTLVAYDTQRAEADNTGVPVRELISRLSMVERCPVVLTLDCCFAGTALGLTESPNREAFNDLMHGFEGQSRIVGCAAEFGQEAYEDREYGKGIFSHALCTRLDEAFATGDARLSAFDWIADAAQRTSGLARTRGRSQTATAFITVKSGRMMVTVPAERPNQLRLLVPSDLPAITEDVDSLAGHGLDRATISAIRDRLGASAVLNGLQRDAVYTGGVLRHQSVFVRAPTSAGKTLVAELAILSHQSTGRKAVVLLPLRAIAREQAKLFSAAYSPLGVRTIVSTGDVHDADDLLLRGQFDVAFLTFEKFSAIILAKPELRDSLGVVVFDELQTIADSGRGHTLEMLLVQVRRWKKNSIWPQIVALCGELADLAPLQQWLNLRAVVSTVRPVPLEEAVIRATTGEARLFNRETRTERREVWETAKSEPTGNEDRARRINAAVPVVQKLLADGAQVLVFCSEKPQARRMAERLARSCGLPQCARLIHELQVLDASTDHQTRRLLRQIASNGIGLHIADLQDGERNAVEDAFRSRELRVIVATSTLGQGVNLPADSVVFVDDVRYDGVSAVPLEVADYRNIAGRAGRLIPNGPRSGLSILVAGNEHSLQQQWQKYIVSDPTPLRSSLGKLCAEDLCLLLLRHFDTASVNDLASTLADTYWATAEQVDSRWKRARRGEIEIALEKLGEVLLVERPAPTEWKLSAVGRIAAGYGLSWISATRVRGAVSEMVTSQEEVDTLALAVLALSTDELERCRCPFGATQVPQKAPARFASRPVLWSVLTSDDSHNDLGNRLHKLDTISKWLNGHSLSDVENHFARDANDRAVAGLFFTILHRLEAVLPAVAAIAAVIAADQASAIREAAARLRLQLSIGAGKEAALLHRLRLGLSRGQCLALVRMHIRDIGDLKTAVRDRRTELEQLLSTPGLERLEVLLADKRREARVSASEPTLAFEGFG